MKLTSELVDGVGKIALPDMGGPHPIENLVRTKWLIRGNSSSPAALNWDVGVFLPLTDTGCSS